MAERRFESGSSRGFFPMLSQEGFSWHCLILLTFYGFDLHPEFPEAAIAPTNLKKKKWALVGTRTVKIVWSLKGCLRYSFM